MDSKEKTKITVSIEIKAGLEFVWDIWTSPEHIKMWNNASDDWHTPRVENDLKEGGKFNYRMETKDGSMGFDFSGVYKRIETNKLIAYTLDDSRKVEIVFEKNMDIVKVIEKFEAESENSIELQRFGWQAILDNFKKYAEAM